MVSRLGHTVRCCECQLRVVGLWVLWLCFGEVFFFLTSNQLAQEPRGVKRVGEEDAIGLICWSCVAWRLAREGVGRVFLPLPLVAMPFPEASLWKQSWLPWGGLVDECW